MRPWRGRGSGGGGGSPRGRPARRGRGRVVNDLKGMDRLTDCLCVRVTLRLCVTMSACGPGTEYRLVQLSVT